MKSPFIHFRRLAATTLPAIIFAFSLSAQTLQPIRDPETSQKPVFRYPPNLKIEKSDATVRISDKVKPDSVAARIADPNHKVTWRPRWNMKGVPGVNLPGFTASSDGSVVALAEVANDDDKDYCSSVIVFYETAEWKIIRAIWLPGMRLIRFQMIPRTVLAIAYVQGQEALDQLHDSLLLINCEKGRVETALQLDKSSGNHFALAGSDEYAVLKYFDRPGLHRFRISSGGMKPEDVKAADRVEANQGVLAYSPDGHQLAWVSARGGLIFDATGITLKKLMLPPGFAPISALFTESGLLLAMPGRDIWYYDSAGNREIKVKGTGLIVWSASDHTLYVEQMVRRALVPVIFPGMEFGKTVSPMKSRPVLAGAAVAYQPIGTGKLAMLTSLGDLVLLEKIKRTWSKTVITSPLR